MSIFSKSLALASAAMFAAGTSQAQITVAITDGGSTTLDCGTGAAFDHVFVDDNASGTYAANGNFTVTVCPDGTNGSKVSLRIFSDQGDTWDIHPSDTLFVYDGTDATAPLLGAFNNTTNPTGIGPQASFNNPSGCLTFVFVSNGSAEGDGFAGILSCGYPCQPFTPTITSTPTEVPADTGWIDICLGDTVWLNGGGIFPYSGTNGGLGYDQTEATSTFNWEFADGTSYTDQEEVYFVPLLRAGYFVEMRMTDVLGCVAATTTRIRVSTLPDFSQTTAQLQDTICLGESTFLTGGVTFSDTAGVIPTQGTFINGGIFAGLTYLPDGSGINYETDIAIDNFGVGQVVENPSDILDICVTMEHSYIGDLEMMLTCPNGTSITMFNAYTGDGLFPGGFGGGGTYLGQALDNGNGTPGIGFEYCFSDNAVWGTIGDELADGNTVAVGGTTPGTSMPGGNYQPEEGYDNLIGCPINGTWTITIRDNQGIDDGYIFEWGVLFNPDIDPNAEYYFPEIETAAWDSDPTIISNQGDTIIEVSPTASGNYSYTFRVSDNFGCQYDTTLTLHVKEINVNVTGQLEVCLQDTAELFVSGSNEGGIWSYVGPSDGTATFFPNEQSENPRISASTAGNYSFTFTDAECGNTYIHDVAFAPAPTIEILFDTTQICSAEQIVLRYNANTDFYDALSWTPFGSNADSLVILGTDSTAYSALDSVFTVSISIENFCGEDEDVFSYKVLDCELILPSIFNPNSEVEANSYFNVEALNLHPGNNMRIYDRWGRVVLDQDDYHLNPWNGENDSDGVYFYVLTRSGYDAITGYVHKVSKGS